VLVVEDEAIVRLLVVEVLNDSATVRSKQATAARAACLESAQRIDLLITDIGLPTSTDGRSRTPPASSGRTSRSCS
jgi:CheY-like chemotaxis protein